MLPPAASASVDSLSISKPYAIGQLTIWIFDAPSPISRPYLTLGEALEEGRAIIHENNSQSLWIENTSDTDLFLQSADLIKGGQQDRMIAFDRIVPAHSTSPNLNVYCIEHGRSTKRGTEPLETFSSSMWRAPLAHSRIVALHALTENLLTPHVGGLTAPDSNELNLLNSLGPEPQPFNYIDAAQESIWNDVSNVQSELTSALKDSVTKNASPTSLELALESPAVEDWNESSESKLVRLIKNDPNAVGFAYAINGKMIAADAYGSHTLFERMWPKLAKAALAEALIGRAAEVHSELSTNDVQEFISFTSTTKTSNDSVNERTKIEARKLDRCDAFQTIDRQFPTVPLHTAWIEREDE